MTSTKEHQSLWKRVIKMETFENTFITEVFKERTRTKLLNQSGNVFADIIREFFANFLVEREYISCWVRQREFSITRVSIQDLLDVRPLSQQITIHYDDRLDSLEPIVELLGGDLKKKALNTVPFTLEMRTLAYIMLHNLYPVKNLDKLRMY